MDKISIYPPAGLRPFYDAPMTKAHKEVCKLRSEHYVELSFSTTTIQPFVRGCYIRYNDSVYTLKNDAAPEALTSADGYRYTLKFYARQHLMEHRVFRWLTGANNEVTFSLTTTIETYAQLLVDNMNAYMGDDYSIKWAYNAIPTEFEKMTKALTFTGVSCWQAMNDIANAFGVEWWVEEMDVYEGTTSVRRIFINFGKCNKGSSIDIREGEIVNRFPPARRGEGDNFGTRFFVYGGTKNIPEDYYEDTTGGVTNHISEKRLHLPYGKEYIDAVEGLSGTEVIEKSIILDDIFPKSDETITAVEARPSKILEWEDTTDVYFIEAANTNFSGKQSDILGTLGITFTSGALNGRSFDVSIDTVQGDETFNGEFEIIAQVEGEDGASQVVIPNQFLKPEVGDTFILTGIRLPEGNVESAELELLDAGTALVKQYYVDTNVYDCPTNPAYCTRNGVDMPLGQNVCLIGAQFGDEGRISRVQGYEKLLYNPYQATYNIGDNNVYSRRLAEIKALNNLTSLEIKRVKMDGKSEYNTIKIMAQSATDMTPKLEALIGNDAWKSVRDIANEVYNTSYPTEIATATQRRRMTTEINPISLVANILYDWSGQTIDSLTLPNLGTGDSAYDNRWMVRVALLSSDSLTIPFDVLWKDGVAPRWSSWCIADITFTKDVTGMNIMGEYKIYR